MTNCCAVLGLISLVITNLATIISFATPYWIQFRQVTYQGLWALCEADNCAWVFEKGYSVRDHHVKVSQEWWIAVQGLTSFGVVLCLFALLLATVALCCESRSCNASHAVSGLLIMAFLSLGVAAVVFGICVDKYHDVGLKMTGNKGSHLGWSFWLDCAAAGLALLTALVYIVEGRGKNA